MRTALSRPGRLVAGVALTGAGLYLIWQCYEGSGRKKPWWTGPLLPW